MQMKEKAIEGKKDLHVWLGSTHFGLLYVDIVIWDLGIPIGRM